MYRIAIFKIRPEPDSTGYQRNYPAEPDIWILVVHSLHTATLTFVESTLKYSHMAIWHWTFVNRTFSTLKPQHSTIQLCLCLHSTCYSMAPGELSSTNCQKGPSTIRLRYPVSGTVLTGTGAGFEKMAGYPANRNWISGTSLNMTIHVYNCRPITNEMVLIFCDWPYCYDIGIIGMSALDCCLGCYLVICKKILSRNFSTLTP